MTIFMRAAVIVFATVIAMFVLLLVGAWCVNGLHQEISLPFVVVVGVVALIGILAVMAVAFKTVGLADPKQALGLPEGTVRAVIALSLILVFAVAVVYLFSDLSGPDVETCKEEIAKLRDEIAAARGTVPPITTVTTGTTATTATSATTATTATTTTNAASSAATATGTAAQTATAPTTKTDTTASAAPKPAGSPSNARAAAEDFAKQLLVMLGTLITSITSFYFGSKAATETTGTRGDGAAPALTGLDTPNPKPGTNVTANGSGLLSVNGVKLLQGASELAATGVSSSDTQVNFTIPSGITAGKWDVVAVSKEGREALLSQAIQI